MDTPNKPSIWRRPFKGWRGMLLLYGILAASVFTIIFVIGFFTGMKTADAMFLAKLAAFAFFVAVCVALVVFIIRWILKNFRKALFGLACLVTLIALFYVEEDVRGKWAWNRFQREWKAKGEKFDFDSLVPPSVPNERNFAMTPVGASIYDWMLDKNGRKIAPPKTNYDGLVLRVYHKDDSSSPTNGEWAEGMVTDLRAWQEYFRTAQTNSAGTVTNEFPVAAKPQTPVEDVLLALSKYDAPIEELRQASRMPESRFPLEYDKDNPAMILLPHLARLIQAVQCLELRAVAELRVGQADKAAADIKLMLYLVQSVRTEPIVISHLVRVKMLSFTMQPIYEGLMEHKWTEAQLAELESELAQFDFVADYRRAIRGDVVFTTKTINYLQHTRKLSEITFSDYQPNNPWTDGICFASPSGWFHQNQIGFAKFYLQQCLPIADTENQTMSPKAAEQAQAYMDGSFAHAGPYNILQRVFLSPVKSMISDKAFGANKFAFGQEAADLARVAIALERYKMAQGKYPESLDVLAPQFIDKLPHDVIGGGPLKYRRTDKGFVLYSIGWNEKDDGEIPARMKNSFPDSDDGDWVWQSPARN